jgi:hypothetical protein
MGDIENRKDYLVTGRECGSCTACCKTLRINAPELKKFAGVLCEHCTAGKGCTIYDTRPQVCRGFYCGWRAMAYLGDEWRPDLCGVLIGVVGEGQGIPAEFRQVGLKFDIVDSPQVLTWDPLIKLIAAEVERKRPVFLGVPTPTGYERRKVFLNYSLAVAVSSRDRHRIVQGLQEAYQIGRRDATKEKTVFN